MHKQIQQYIQERISYYQHHQNKCDNQVELAIQETLKSINREVTRIIERQKDELKNVPPDMGIILRFETACIQATTVNPELIGKRILILNPENEDHAPAEDFCAIQKKNGETYYTPGFVVEIIEPEDLLGEVRNLTPLEKSRLFDQDRENPVFEVEVEIRKEKKREVDSDMTFDSVMPFIGESGIPLL